MQRVQSCSRHFATKKGVLTYETCMDHIDLGCNRCGAGRPVLGNQRNGCVIRCIALECNSVNIKKGVAGCPSPHFRIRSTLYEAKGKG